MIRKLNYASVAVACCLLLASPARAAFDTVINVKVGDKVVFDTTPGRLGNGGPFLGTINTPSSNTWIAYCVEGGGGPVEYISFGSNYTVKSITANIASNTGNIVTEAAKYLYHAAGSGSLVGYDPTNASQNEALQNAIWSLVVKGNIGWNPAIVNPAIYVNSAATYLSAAAGTALTYRDAAINAVAAANGNQAANLALAARVSVLNPTGSQAEVQSMLFEVPEPASLVVWSVLGGGAAGLTIARRRREARKNARWSQENRSAIFAVVDRHDV